jgi:outer membrane protein OmpA-like peptidoglycan-associated protein
MSRLLFFFLLYSFQASSQGLLVNGGFEELNTCTEYNVECAPEGWMSSASGFFNYFKDPNRAHSGSNCMAIEAAHFQKRYSRTYLRSRLLCGLRKDHEYRIEFFIKSAHPILDSVGLIFFDSDPLYSKTFMQGTKPAFYLKGVVDASVFGDSSWRKVSLTYRATGNEVYLLIGYFAKNDYKGERLSRIENRYYVFLDDFSMIPVDPDEHLCSGWQQAKEDIYEENERHELLERKIKYYRTRPPLPPQLERNSYTVIDTLVLPDILFETGKAALQQGSFAVMDSICKGILGKQVDSLVVKGHTDNTGTTASNETLSANRAKTVADYMALRISRKPVPVFIYGLADRIPVASNNTPQGKQKNRRVEILVYLRE